VTCEFSIDGSDRTRSGQRTFRGLSLTASPIKHILLSLSLFLLDLRDFNMASHQQLLDSIQTPRHPTFVGKYRTLLNMVDAVANMFDSSKLRRKEREALEFWTSQAKSALGCAIDTISRPHGKKEGEMRFAGREYVELESYLEWLKAHSGPGRTFNTAHSLVRYNPYKMSRGTDSADIVGIRFAFRSLSLTHFREANRYRGTSKTFGITQASATHHSW